MNIDVPLRELGAIDTTALRDAILGQEDAAWYEDEYREQTYHHHDQTQSIVLVSIDELNWPDRNVRKGPGWEGLADVAVPVMQEIIKNTIRRAARSFVRWRPGSWPAEKSRRMVTCTNRFIVATVSMCRLRRIQESGSRSMADRTNSKSGRFTKSTTRNSTAL